MKKSVAIVMGSKSDYPTMKDAEILLKKMGVSVHVEILSAHRTPDAMANFAKSAKARGFQVIIAGAGGAAHLPGMVAAYSELPVIGVPVAIGELKGKDALLSIAQMPKGVPVACVAINNATNAGLLAIQILSHGGSVGNKVLSAKFLKYKHGLRNKVLKSKIGRK